MAFVTPTPILQTTFQQRSSFPIQHLNSRQSRYSQPIPTFSPPTTRSSCNVLNMITTTPSRAPDNPAVSSLELYDVIVIGGGPAGLSLSTGLGKRGINVLCADVSLNKSWPNNYGTWIDELEPLGLADCTSHVWEKTAAHVRADGRKSELNRAYARVDRIRLKERFIDHCNRSGKVSIVHAAARELDVNTSEDHTIVQLEMLDEQNLNMLQKVAGRVIVDATGHSLKFVQFPPGKTPGMQAAYGIECRVSEKGYPFDNNEMMLMDYRDDHMQASKEDRELSENRPTFIYVMPLDQGKGRHVFFEETSLVASPAMDFDMLKERMYKRLNYYGVEVDEVIEEEFCLIPMGGEMPNLRQRIVAFGGSAALVHPATGYMIARALKLADDAAEIISTELAQCGNADETAHRIWDRIWNESRRRQRDFFNFGGEYLQRVGMKTTREFFSAFFELPKEQWSGFLSFRLIKPLERLTFGLGMFLRTTNHVRFDIITQAILKGRFPLLMSVMPLYKVEEDDKK